eukprot:gene2963-1945_t
MGLYLSLWVHACVNNYLCASFEGVTGAGVSVLALLTYLLFLRALWVQFNYFGSDLCGCFNCERLLRVVYSVSGFDYPSDDTCTDTLLSVMFPACAFHCLRMARLMLLDPAGIDNVSLCFGVVIATAEIFSVLRLMLHIFIYAYHIGVCFVAAPDC